MTTISNRNLSIILFAILLVAVLSILFFRYKKRPSAPPSPLTCPAQKFDLSSWEITLPIESDNNSQSPLIIRQPQLAKYQNNPWFMLTPDNSGIIFRAPVNAPTTPNSNYPRSELREMTDNGTTEAFWSSVSGIHSLILDEAITAVPKKKSAVVAGQVHGDDDDILFIRLEYPKLYIARGGKNVFTLNDNYTLGQRFKIKIVASDGKFMFYYNGNNFPVHTLDKKVNKAYFKAGVYTQSNCKTEGSPDLCNENNYGEVIIYNLSVDHRG